MNERDLRVLIEDVKSGHLSRRKFIEMMVGAGLTAPFATQMLAYSGVAHAQAPSPYKPTKRGGGGTLKILWWQGPTLPGGRSPKGRGSLRVSAQGAEPAVWHAQGRGSSAVRGAEPARF